MSVASGFGVPQAWSGSQVANTTPAYKDTHLRGGELTEHNVIAFQEVQAYYGDELLALLKSNTKDSEIESTCLFLLSDNEFRTACEHRTDSLMVKLTLDLFPTSLVLLNLRQHKRNNIT